MPTLHAFAPCVSLFLLLICSDCWLTPYLFNSCCVVDITPLGARAALGESGRRGRRRAVRIGGAARVRFGRLGTARLYANRPVWQCMPFTVTVSPAAAGAGRRGPVEPRPPPRTPACSLRTRATSVRTRARFCTPLTRVGPHTRTCRGMVVGGSLCVR